jgi:hypothetical protein
MQAGFTESFAGLDALTGRIVPPCVLLDYL